MIRVTCKRIPTMVNKKMTQEQTLIWNDVVLEQNRHLVFTARTGMDYGSSYKSVFKSPTYLVHNGHEFESPITEFGSHERVQNTVTRNETRREEGKLKHTCTSMHVHTHTHVHLRVHVYTILYIHIYMYNYQPTLQFKYIHSYTHTHTHIYIHKQTHAHLDMLLHSMTPPTHTHQHTQLWTHHHINRHTPI